MIVRDDTTRTAVGVALVDQSRRIVECDEPFCRIVGKTRDALLGQPAERFDVHFSDMGQVAWVEDRKAEARHREQEAVLAHAEQIVGIGSWVWYPEENRHSWSPGARRIYDMTDAEAETGEPALFFRAVHPEDRESIFRGAWDSYIESRKSSAEYRVVHRDGSVRWVRGQSDVELDADGKPVRVIGAVVDVTERRLAELELREMTAMVERAYEVSGIASFNVDLETRNVTIRGAVAGRLGGAETMTMDVDRFRAVFVHDDDRPIWTAKLERAYRVGGPFTLEHRLIDREERAIWIRLHGAVECDEFGFPERALGVMQDVTEQRMLEEQLRQVQKLDAVGQLAGGIAHDFNNLLLVIGGNAQLAKLDGVESDEIQEILNATERARDLVRQLLTFSRSDPKEPRILDLNDVVGGVERMLRRLIATTVDLRLELADTRLGVLADKGRLEQVLVNLAVNGRDAMSGAGTLTISTAMEDDRVVLRVTDTGEGMDEETKQRVFDPFFTTKERGRGTGLGLSTVYGIVVEAGGRIEIDTEVGKGTTFAVSLPHATELAFEQPSMDTGARVLVVDDDETVQTVVASMLRRSGYDVVTVGRPSEAIDLLDAGQRVDALICDISLPGMSGTQLSHELQRRGHDLPTVYTSGYGSLAAVPVGDGSPVGFVAKPFEGDEVADALRDLLHRAA